MSEFLDQSIGNYKDFTRQASQEEAALAISDFTQPMHFSLYGQLQSRPQNQLADQALLHICIPSHSEVSLSGVSLRKTPPDRVGRKDTFPNSGSTNSTFLTLILQSLLPPCTPFIPLTWIHKTARTFCLGLPKQ